jgi:hypothetical protein
MVAKVAPAADDWLGNEEAAHLLSLRPSLGRAQSHRCCNVYAPGVERRLKRKAGAGRARELVFCAAYVLAGVLVPLAFEELYPFSRVAIFVDAPQFMCTYRAWLPNGAEVPLQLVGLDRQYVALRGFTARHPERHTAAVLLPPTIDRSGVVPDEGEIVAIVAGRLAQTNIPYLDVEQTVLGAMDTRISPISQRRFRVERPRTESRP